MLSYKYDYISYIYSTITKHNFTQEFLASKIGISRPTYIQIEQGSGFNYIEVKNLAEIFDTSFEDLLI